MRLDLFIHVLGDQKQIDILIKQGELIMETVQTLNEKLDNLTNVVTAERAEVQSMIADLKAEIQRLTDQIGQGTPATQADLDGLGARIDLATTNIQAISEAAPPTPPTV